MSSGGGVDASAISASSRATPACTVRCCALVSVSRSVSASRPTTPSRRITHGRVRPCSHVAQPCSRTAESDAFEVRLG